MRLRKYGGAVEWMSMENNTEARLERIETKLDALIAGQRETDERVRELSAATWYPSDTLSDDALYEVVREFVIHAQLASLPLLQQRFEIGYGRACRLMDRLEQEGVVFPSDGTSELRKVIVKK